MKGSVRAGLIALAAILWLAPPAARAETAVSAQQAHEIGVSAYQYLYPLVTMDITRRQSTNVEAGTSEFGGPANSFVNVPAYPSADFRTVVRPNFDTLYSSAWLDLTGEPVVVSIPDTAGRYYLLPMLDMWTDVFASPGWRTTGTAEQHFLVAPPGWSGTVPAGVARIDAPTPHVWIIGRIQTGGPEDYPAVHAIQDGLAITLLSQWGGTATPPAVVPDPTVDMKTPPKQQVDAMTAGAFFAYAAEVLKVNPPHLTDQPILAQLAKLGFEPGRSFDLEAAPEEVRQGLANVPEDAQKLMAWKLPSLAGVVNGWSMNTSGMGVYGNDYLKRALIAQVGLGANLPEDAIYPLNLADADGKPLDGANSYRLRFAREELPPVDAFWSVTLYDPEGYQVANPLNRFAVSSWMPLKTDPDGSIELYVQHESPGGDGEANWLPAPEGPFNLILRLYAPKAEVVNGAWSPPPVVRVSE